MTTHKVEEMESKLTKPFGGIDPRGLAEVLCEMEENWNWVAERLKAPIERDEDSYKSGYLAALEEMEKCFTRTKTNSPQFKDGVDVQFNIHKFRAILDELKKKYE